MRLISRRKPSSLYDGFFIYRVQQIVLPEWLRMNLLWTVLMKYCSSNTKTDKDLVINRIILLHKGFGKDMQKQSQASFW